MRRSFLMLLAMALLVVHTLFLSCPGLTKAAPDKTVPPSVGGISAKLATLPLYFAENRGQWDNRVLFMAHTRQGELAVSDDHVALLVPRDKDTADMVKLRPVGADPAAKPRPGRVTGAGMSFLFGNDPAAWHTGVPTYDAVLYEGVYPGVDLRYHGDNRVLEYDFLVAPGADPSRIRMRLDGVAAVRLDADGAMVLTLAGGGELRQAPPVVYQEKEGVRIPVAAGFALAPGEAGQGREFGFALAAYDKALPLVIDPVLTYSTFLGGAINDYAYGLAVRETGGVRHVVVAGNTFSTPFIAAPVTPSPVEITGTVRAMGDVFVASINDSAPVLNTLDYAVVIGGSKADQGQAVAINDTGAKVRVYVTGTTASPNFPTTSALWPSLSGTLSDAFVLCLEETVDPVSGGITPALLFSTFYGGSGVEAGNAIALDDAGAVYVAGSTTSTDLPVKNALYSANSGTTDGFVLKLNATGTQQLYATYFGGSKDDSINALAVTPSEGDVFIAGATLSANLPVKNALQTSIGSTTSKDGFIARINPTCSELVFATYLGGSGMDWINGLARDGAGNLVVTGTTNSTNFPVVNPLYPSLAGGYDAFVAGVDVSGRFLRFATYLGGAGNDAGNSVAVDRYTSTTNQGPYFIYVGGETESTNFPTENAWTATTAAGVTQNGYGYRGEGDGFIAKFEPNGLRLVYSSYLGGTADDSVRAVATPPNTAAVPDAVNGTMMALVAGYTVRPTTLLDSSAFPATADAVKTVPIGTAGKPDAFVSHIDDTSYGRDLPVLSVSSGTAPPLTSTTLTLPVVFTDASPASSVSAVSMTLTFNASMLEVQDVTLNSSAAYADFKHTFQDLGNGRLYIMVYQNAGGSPETLPSGATVVNVKFRIKYSGGSMVSKISLAASATKSTASGNVDVPIAGVPGIVQITQRCSQLGDCDCSGSVKLWEVQQAVRLSLGQYATTPSWYACVITDYSTTMLASDLQQVINNHLFGGGITNALPSRMCKAADAAGSQVTLGSPAVAKSGMTVPLRLADDGQVVSTLLSDITYDATRFSVASVTAGAAAVAAGKSVQSNVVEPGRLRVVVTSTSGGKAIGNGDVAVVAFRTVGKDSGRGTLSVQSSAAASDASDVGVVGNSVQFGRIALGALNLLLPQ